MGKKKSGDRIKTPNSGKKAKPDAPKDVQMEVVEEVEAAVAKDDLHQRLKVKMQNLKSSRQKVTKKAVKDGKLHANPKKLQKQIKGRRYGRANY